MAESITRKNIDLDILDYYDGKIKNYVDNKVGTGSLTIDKTLSDTSENPVQNKVIKQAIDNKADKTVATTSADGLMSAEDKGKLDAFEITTTGGKLHDKDIATLDDIPTELPASNVTDIYSATGTEPVNGKAVASAISTKVDKISGKSLSTNDLTNTLKNNYDAAYTHSQSAHAPSSAQANVIETIKVNNTALTPTNKTVNISVPSNTDRYVNKAVFADDSTATAANPIKMTLTRAGSDTNTITANIPKVSSSSAGVVPKGAAVSSQSKTTKFLREDGTWAAPSYTTNTDTKVTSAANHYTPAKSTTKSASGGTLTDITNSTSGTQVVTGVEMDAKGHVTGVTSVALKSTDSKVTVDSTLSSTSTNPVQNKVINSALAGKAAASHSHTISQISDFPASLPANGGNADTIDGLHADNFLLKSNSMVFNGIAINADRHSIGDVNNYWSLWTDNEGGNFELRSPDKNRAIQMDCFDNNIFRIYSWLGTNFWGLLEANHITGEVKINGRPNHRIPTLTSDCGVYDINHEHTNDAFIQWDGSSYFKLKTYSGHLTAVDYATNSNNSNTLGGIVDAYHLGTFSTAGDGHGADWQLYCRHNIYGDGRFGFRVGDGSSQIRCDYATEAGKPYVTGTFTHNGSAVTVNLGFTPSIVIWGDGQRCYIAQGSTNSFIATATAYTQIDFLSGGSNNFRHNMTNVPCYYIAFK